MAKRIFETYWKKERLITKVCSEYEEGKKVGKFTFKDYNPFPCYSMESTYGVVSAWLRENGWGKTDFCKETILVDNVETKKEEPVYLIKHVYQIDGGLGDAIQVEDIMFITYDGEKAKKYVERYNKPELYNGSFYRHELKIEKATIDSLNLDTEPSWFDDDDE